MKILIPILSLGKSGGIKVLCNLANYWLDDGHDVAIVTPYTYSQIYYPINCILININKIGDSTSVIATMNTLEKVYSLSRYIHKNHMNFDSIIANHYTTSFPVAFFSKSMNYYYIQAYEPDFSNESRNFIKKYTFKIISWLSYFLPLIRIVNADIYKAYKNIKSDYCVYPGINTENFYARNRRFKSFNDTFYIGTIGRTETWKGSSDVAEAIEILHRKGYTNIVFYVAFNPVKYEKHTLLMPDNERKLADFYRTLDILIVAGQIQLNAIHYPVIEALITKTPLITTGYFPSSEENSSIVKIKSPHDIAEKIKYMLHNYELAIKKANFGYEKTVNEFDWLTISRKFISIMQSNKIK